MYPPARTWTDLEPMSAYALNEVSDAFSFLRSRKIFVPTGNADDAVFQQGQVTIDTNLNATATGAVTFPSSMPSSDPKILLTPINTSIYGATVESISATGFTTRIREILDRTLDVNIPVNWWALDKSGTAGGTSWAAPRRWTAEAVSDTLLDTEWKNHFDWLKRQLLEAKNASDENKHYRHGVVYFNSRADAFSETITFDSAFGTVPNIQVQAQPTSVYIPCGGSVSATGCIVSIREINETVLSVKDMKVFWLGIG